MGSILESQGLDNIVVERKTKDNYPRQWSRFWTEGLIAAGIDSVSKLPEGEMREKMAKLVDGASEDARRGVGWCGDHFCVVGRKAAAA